MTEQKKKLQSPVPDLVTSLRTTLCYSVQHRNAIQNWLHREIPAVWPAEALEEIEFYERIKTTAEDEIHAEIFWNALFALATKKAKWKGRIVPLEPRLIGQGIDFSKTINNEGASACLELLLRKNRISLEECEELWDCLAESGHVQFKVVSSWLMTKNTSNKNEENSLTSEISSSETNVEAWKRIWESVAEITESALSHPPNEGDLQKFRESLVSLESALGDHEAIENQNLRSSVISLLETIEIEGGLNLSATASALKDALGMDVNVKVDLSTWFPTAQALWENKLSAKSEFIEAEQDLVEAVDRRDFTALVELGPKTDDLQKIYRAKEQELIDHLKVPYELANSLEAGGPSFESMETTQSPAKIFSGGKSDSNHDVEHATLTISTDTSKSLPTSSQTRAVDSVVSTQSIVWANDSEGDRLQAGELEEVVTQNTKKMDEAPLDKIEYEAALEQRLVDFSIDADVDFFVHQATQDCAQQSRSALNGLVWRLVLDNRAGLAAHLSDSIEANYGEECCLIPPVLLHAVAIAEQLNSPVGESAQILKELILSLFAMGFDERPIRKQRLLSLYGIAATLRPSLVAPDTTMAHELLGTIHLDDELSALHQLRQAILESRYSGVAQNPAFLRMANEYAEWKEQLTLTSNEAKAWWVSNRHKTFKYGHATHVWQHWLGGDQPLGKLIGMITSQDSENGKVVDQIIDLWSRKSEIEVQIKGADDLLRGRKANLRPIEGGAKQDLIRHVQEPLDLGRRWLEVMKSKPGSVEDSVTRQARDLRDRIQSIATKCESELDILVDKIPDSLQTAAAVHTVKKAVKGVLKLIGQAVGDAHLTPIQLVNAELLHLPQPPEADNWSPTEIVEISSLIEIALKSENDWAETLANHGRSCRNKFSERLISYLETCEFSAIDLDALSAEQDEMLRACRRRLKARVEEVRIRIEAAVAGDQMPEAERLRMIDRLEAANDVNAINIKDNIDSLANIDADIDRRLNDHVREIRGRIETGGLASRHPHVAQRIELLLAQGDTLTANEYIALAENDLDLPHEEQQDDSFLSYFPSKLGELMEFLGDNNQVRNALKAVGAGQNIGPLKMNDVPGTQATGAAKMLEAWFQLKSRQGEVKRNLHELLSRIGFQVEEITPEPSKAQAPLWAELRVRPIKDRNICPIPRYGSLAQGRYQLLCVWKEITEDEILSLTNQQGRDVPIIVLYLARMSEARRRALAHLCLERRQTVITLDETLIFNLCMEHGLRLRVLFQCTFPFTTNNPYTIASSNVPVEMFFGRQRELSTLLDPFGSNLVYGGRQLGKTALLREVQRRYHDPQAGVSIQWIDLKAQGIGLSRPSSELWEVIHSTLRAEKITKGNVKRHETICEQITEWLEADDNRRVLLLLDESDAFLAEDSRDKERSYRTIGHLKELMDRTNRRFKVVLAGLHNVQRTARDVNTPIAHMGMPVCVGPLLENGEVREAMKLVTLPFHTLGFRFKPDVVSRILSHTNYYPSLIQIFCRHLLDVLNEKFRQPAYRSTTPPYEITAQHVAEAYLHKELRNTIAERFRFTLELDGRYKVIALRIALETLERRSEGVDTAAGYDVEWVRKESLELWPQGFPETSFETFRTLMDEMIGLGILRRAGPDGNRYALRSPNVISLLGTQDEIMESLLDAAEKEPPLVYEAATYRRFFADDPWQRSPLTGQQESQILMAENGVCVLFGLAVAGIHKVKDFLLPLKQNLSAVDAFELPLVNNLRELESSVQRIIQDLDVHQEGVVLMIVDPATPWADSWVESIAAKMRLRRTKKLHCRVLFIGDAASAWHWVTMEERVRRELESLQVTTIALQPWQDDAVRRWMEDAGFGPVSSPEGRAAFSTVTGNWGEVLHALGDEIRPNMYGWSPICQDFVACAEQGWFEDIKLPADRLEVLKTLETLGETTTVDDLTELTDLPIETVRDTLHWADLLNIVQVTGRDAWRMDPWLARFFDRFGR